MDQPYVLRDGILDCAADGTMLRVTGDRDLFCRTCGRTVRLDQDEHRRLGRFIERQRRTAA